MNSRMVVAGTLIILGLTGCLPEKRVVWSPDGRLAAVRGGDKGLYLCDESGELSNRLADNVSDVAWFPDSQRVVFSRSITLNTWEDLSQAMPSDKLEALKQLGELLRAEALAHEGTWDDFQPRTLEGASPGESAAAILYLRDRRSEGLAEKVGKSWNDLDKATMQLCTLQMGKVSSTTLVEGSVLARGFDPMTGLCVSPDGRNVAYGALSTNGATMQPEPARYDSDRRSIFVVPVGGDNSPREVARRTTMRCDWSPDGTYLAYIAASIPFDDGSDGMPLGVVARRMLCDEAGALMPQFPDAEELAGLLFDELSEPHYLPDGRIVFPTIEVQLPCTSADMPQHGNLFAVDPGRQPTVVRLIPRQSQTDLPDAIGFSEPSPDGKHICIPGSDGRIAILNVATGDVWHGLATTEVPDLRTLPSWRSASELSFVVLADSGSESKHAALTLGRIDWDNREARSRSLSEAWPADVVTGMLVKEPDEQSTTGSSPVDK